MNVDVLVDSPEPVGMALENRPHHMDVYRRQYMVNVRREVVSLEILALKKVMSLVELGARRKEVLVDTEALPSALHTKLVQTISVDKEDLFSRVEVVQKLLGPRTRSFKMMLEEDSYYDPPWSAWTTDNLMEIIDLVLQHKDALERLELSASEWVPVLPSEGQLNQVIIAQSRLTHVKLYDCNLQNSTLQTLATECPVLSHLDVRENEEVDGRGLLSFWSPRCVNKKLETCLCENTSVSLRAVAKLAAAFSSTIHCIDVLDDSCGEGMLKILNINPVPVLPRYIALKLDLWLDSVRKSYGEISRVVPHPSVYDLEHYAPEFAIYSVKNVKRLNLIVQSMPELPTILSQVSSSVTSIKLSFNNTNFKLNLASFYQCRVLMDLSVQDCMITFVPDADTTDLFPQLRLLELMNCSHSHIPDELWVEIISSSTMEHFSCCVPIKESVMTSVIGKCWLSHDVLGS